MSTHNRRSTDKLNEPRPRVVIILVFALALLSFGMGIFLFANLFRTNGSGSYWKLAIASVFARSFLTVVEDAVAEMAS